MNKNLLWAGLVAFPIMGAFLACGDNSSPGNAGSGAASGSSGGNTASGSTVGVVTSGSSGSDAGSGGDAGSGNNAGSGSAMIGLLFDSGAFSLDAGFTPTGTCLTLSNCCASLSSNLFHVACDLALSVTFNDQTLCAQELAGFQDAGICH